MKNVFNNPAMMYILLTQVLGLKDDGNYKESWGDIIGVLIVFFLIPGILAYYFFG